VTDQPRHPRPSRHPAAPPARRPRARAIFGALLLPLATAAPAASAIPSPTEPPAYPPPPPPAETTPGLPLWAVLVIVGGAITLAAATTLITLALQPGKSRKPGPPARTAPARATHQSSPAARPGAREHTSAAAPPGPPHPPADHRISRMITPANPGHRRMPGPITGATGLPDNAIKTGLLAAGSDVLDLAPRSRARRPEPANLRSATGHTSMARSRTESAIWPFRIGSRAWSNTSDAECRTANDHPDSCINMYSCNVLNSATYVFPDSPGRRRLG
jgi:hypothetical protein